MLYIELDSQHRTKLSQYPDLVDYTGRYFVFFYSLVYLKQGDVPDRGPRLPEGAKIETGLDITPVSTPLRGKQTSRIYT